MTFDAATIVKFDKVEAVNFETGAFSADTYLEAVDDANAYTNNSIIDGLRGQLVNTEAGGAFRAQGTNGSQETIRVVGAFGMNADALNPTDLKAPGVP